MAITWPVGLPQFVLEEGFQESFADQTIENTTDSGAPRSRRRFTAKWIPLTFVIMCDEDQVVAFEEFYYDTTKSGSLVFEWKNPRTEEACRYRFRRPPPQLQPKAENVRIMFNLWRVP